MLRARWPIVLISLVLAMPALAQPALDIRQNPAPLERLEIDWRFDGAPGLKQAPQISALYEIETIDCLPVDHAGAPGGIRLRPSHWVQLVPQPGPPGAFRTTVFADALLAVDAFGLGPCRWALAGIRLTFHSPHHRVPFVASLASSGLRNAASHRWYFRQEDFRKAPPPPMQAIFGETAGYYPGGDAQFTLNGALRWHKR